MSVDSVAGYTLLLQISKNSRHETNYHILLRNLIGFADIKNLVTGLFFLNLQKMEEINQVRIVVFVPGTFQARKKLRNWI